MGITYESERKITQAALDIEVGLFEHGYEA